MKKPLKKGKLITWRWAWEDIETGEVDWENSWPKMTKAEAKGLCGFIERVIRVEIRKA